jgi:signal transduction histidine kinase/ligand-binding sensor domain-containing protein
MIVRRTLSVLFTFLSIWMVPAQELPENISFEHLSIPGAIRSADINDVIQDPEGVIWIASDGLYRYDGHNFNRYENLPDGNSIGGKEINSLFYDQVGKRLLIATRNYGIVEYSYQNNALRQLPSVQGTPVVNYIEQTSDGRIWASTFVNNLIYIDNDTLKPFTRLKFSGSSTIALLAMQEQLLVGDAARIYIIANNQLADSIYLKWPGYQFNSFARVSALAHDRKGKLYIGTEKQGVLIYDLVQKKFTKFFSPEVSPFYNRINRIFVDQQGLVWILTKSGGLVVYSPEKDSFINLIKNPFFPNSISGDNCTSIIEDQTGIIWLGATGNLNTYDPNKIQFTHITHNPLSENSLSDKMVRGIVESSDGKILIGTDGGYINFIDPKTHSIEKIKIDVPESDDVFVAMYFHNLDDGTLLIGTNRGLLKMNPKKRSFEFYKPLYPVINNTQVRQILQSKNKLFLIATGKLIRYDLQTGKIDVFNDYSQPQDKGVINPTVLQFDHQGRLWLGVYNGVSRMNDDDTFSYFPFNDHVKRPEGSYLMVLSMEEINGKFWLGTFNAGLWQMEIPNGNETPALIKITEPEFLSYATIYGTLEDEKGDIWISTNEGLAKFEADRNRLTRFSLSEGLQEEEYNRLAYCKTRQGLLVFGGINGINIFNPSDITITTTPTQAYLISFSSNGNPNEHYYQDLRNQSSVSLPYKQNSFTLQFNVPNYQQPSRFSVETLLENHENQWSSVSGNRVSYSNLKPGNYIFQVKVKDRDGTERISSLSIGVNYPFWLQWWFILLSVACLGLGIFGIARLYSARTLRDKQRLERILKERTQEIEESRAELADLNQKKDLIFSILSHDLRGPLTTLKGFLSLLIDNTDALPKEDIRKHANNIRNSLNSSIDLLDNTLYWSLSQTGNISFTPSDFSLNKVLTKIHQLYQLTADQKKIDFHLDVKDPIHVYGDENMIYVVFRNIVSNALKFTKEGKRVDILAYQENGTAHITVKDQGVGMSADDLLKLISDDQPVVKTGTALEKGTGLGLVLCKNFIRLNQGDFHINSVEKEGTEFTVILPRSTHNQDRK